MPLAATLLWSVAFAQAPAKPVKRPRLPLPDATARKWTGDLRLAPENLEMEDKYYLAYRLIEEERAAQAQARDAAREDNTGK